jgi:hypothetical protein
MLRDARSTDRMGNSQDYHDWHPTQDQELLLQAALLSGDRARESWQEWTRRASLDRLDYGSERLLPLLYHHLKSEGIDHPWAIALGKKYLVAWTKNQVLFAKASALLQQFLDAGISTMLLKGAALTVRYYKDFGVRPMSDFDFLVPTHRIREAIELVQRLGWIPRLKSPERSLPAFISSHHALVFQNPGKFDLDLHWHVLVECLDRDADQEFWERTVPIQLNGVPTLCLSPADELFHVCIHGARWNFMPPIRWVADAVTILHSGLDLDLNRIISLAEKRLMILPLRDTLLYLKDQFDLSLLTDVLKVLNRLPVTPQDDNEYKTRKSQPYALVPYLWEFYPRISRDTGRRPGLLGFVKYLRDFWELDYTWQVPLSFTWRVMRKILKLRVE